MSLYETVSLERSAYSDWKDIVGNVSLKEYFRAMVRSITGPERGRGINTLVIGPSRTGKTSTIELSIKAMLCSRLNQTTLTPCGECTPCRQCEGRYEHIAVDVIRFGGDDGDVSFVPIDGNNATADDLEQAIDKSKGHSSERWIYSVDEIQGLVRRHLDHALLKPLDQLTHITWIVSTATTVGLEPMFRNRFTEERTELPSLAELSRHLARVCLSNQVSWDDDSTIATLAQRSGRITGRALQCIAKAKMIGGQLTLALVEGFNFGLLD